MVAWAIVERTNAAWSRPGTLRSSKYCVAPRRMPGSSRRRTGLPRIEPAEAICGDYFALFRAEPPLPSGRTEVLLRGRERQRRLGEDPGRCRPAEEVDVELRDLCAAELDVARRDALVRGGMVAAAQAVHQHVGDGAGLSLGDHTDARHGRARDVADRVHVRKA